MSIFFTQISDAQVLVTSTGFDNYAGSVATVPAGWFCSWNTAASFYTSTGNYGVAAPSYKFGNDSDFVVAPKVNQGIYQVSFFVRGNGVPFSSGNELQLYQSQDSVFWTLVTSIDSLPVTGTVLTANLNGSPYVKFLYHKQPAGGNLAFDDVMIYTSNTPVNAVNNAEAIKIYPSPSTGLVYVKIPEPKAAINAEVFDILGNSVLSVKLEKESPGLFSLDFTGESKGLYFVKIINGDKVFTRRITIIK